MCWYQLVLPKHRKPLNGRASLLVIPTIPCRLFSNISGLMACPYQFDKSVWVDTSCCACPLLRLARELPYTPRVCGDKHVLDGSLLQRGRQMMTAACRKNGSVRLMVLKIEGDAGRAGKRLPPLICFMFTWGSCSIEP